MFRGFLERVTGGSAARMSRLFVCIFIDFASLIRRDQTLLGRIQITLLTVFVKIEIQLLGVVVVVVRAATHLICVVVQHLILLLLLSFLLKLLLTSLESISQISVSFTR